MFVRPAESAREVSFFGRKDKHRQTVEKKKKTLFRRGQHLALDDCYRYYHKKKLCLLASVITKANEPAYFIWQIYFFVISGFSRSQSMDLLHVR